MGLFARTRLGRPRHREYNGTAGALLNGRANADWRFENLGTDIHSNRTYPPYPRTQDDVTVTVNGAVKQFGTTAEPRHLTFVAADQNTKAGFQFTNGNEPADADVVGIDY